MTPQERQLIDDLFDRLSKLETAPRDPEAQAAIADGLRRAPNAVYALVQTVLVQDEALKQAEAHIKELEERNQPQQQQSGGFLDSMRDSLLGPSAPRGSVPNVRPGDSGAPRGAVWNTGQTGYQPDPRATPDYRQGAPGGGGFGGGLFGGGNPAGGNPGGGGGSFLGTAAATAAGVIGGSMLMNSMRGMFGGGGHQQSFGDTASSTKSPWDNNNSQSGGDLSRDAGLNDVGKSGHDDDSRQSLADNSSYDQANNNYDDDHDDDNDDDYDGDDDFGGSDDSDFA